ncbi:MAG TPA: type III-B CRISPR module RAMP protein Cmr1 [Streptosporangiaceae bacterium]|nr:type III-B CRISPR module RAMP protein Cmr1 [Streptosporangiaceae bacterium]
MTWTTLTLQVTTPLFNGGADPDDSYGFRPGGEAGLRVASIRGAMRFWFRALAGTVAGPDLRLLADLERHVFGDAGNPSPVQLRIPAQPRAERTQAPGFLNGGERGKWLAYLLGQGLTTWNRDTRRFQLSRPGFVDAGQSFELKLRFAAEEAGALALGALRLCCLYGGFGARTRRGFGGVQITGVSGPLPGPWTGDSLRTGGLRDYAGVRTLWPSGNLAVCRDILAGLREKLRPSAGPVFDDEWAEPPPYPVLSRSRTVVGVSGGEAFGDWRDVLWHAGEQLRHFRADRENTSPCASYRPKIETREWKEVVHGPSDRFGLGALGLPVVYKDDYVVNVDRGAGEKLRRASPLWLRAVGSDGNWRLLSFAFLGRFLPGPNAPGVHLWQDNRQRKALDVTDADMRSLADQWIRALRADQSFTDTAHRT